MSKQLFDIDAFRAQPLPTEAEIMDSWQGDIKKPVVSVLCHTFNQEMYIEDAFRGFLLQKTSFVFEVIVHDDASSDGTSDIVREYAKQYPKIFKPIIQTENQYSQGKKPSLLSSAHAKGEYFALCEGDDFWIAEDKLMKQLEFILESTALLVIHPAYKYFNTGTFEVAYTHTAKYLTLRDVLDDSAEQFAPTASYFMHKSLLKVMPDWFSTAPIGDLFIEIQASLLGRISYMPNIKSVYRINAESSWSNDMDSNLDKPLNFHIGMVETLTKLKPSIPDEYKININNLFLKHLKCTSAYYAKKGETKASFEYLKKYVEEGGRINKSSLKTFIRVLLSSFVPRN